MNFEPVAWNNYRKDIPERPQYPEMFSKLDERHWFDMEYAGWGVKKINLPESGFEGPKNKEVICLLPGAHPYFIDYAKSMLEMAQQSQIQLTILYGDWDLGLQAKQVDYAISCHPDLVILVPSHATESTKWYKKINQYGIPVIASNFLPEDEGFKYILGWTGPDDWGQTRKLTHKFADLMAHKGGYCIIRHRPGTSSYYARTYGVLTELGKIAPEMKLLDMETSDLNCHQTKCLVLSWLKTFGKDLKGIVSADDSGCIEGINEALRVKGRKDIIVVATGTTQVGIEYMREGALSAVTYQSPQIDGTMPMQLAVDWFNGLLIEPIRYLPVYILSLQNLQEFLKESSQKCHLETNQLVQAIMQCKAEDIHGFFEDAYEQLTHNRGATREFFYGFCMELSTALVQIVREKGLIIQGFSDGYETLYKNLFMQKTIKNTLEWLKSICLKISIGLSNADHIQKDVIKEILEDINKNYSKPLSIKTLSHEYNISPGYLGQLIKKDTGKMFNHYLNDLRIDKAKKLLLQTKMTSKEIALVVGFENPDYFYYVFRKYTGVFPSEFVSIKM